MHSTQPDEQNSQAVLAKALFRAAAMMQLTDAELATILGLSQAAVSDSKAKADPDWIQVDSKTGQSACKLIRIYRALELLTGTADAMKLWLHSYNDAVGAVPADLLTSQEGLQHVMAYLEGMQAPA